MTTVSCGVEHGQYQFSIATLSIVTESRVRVLELRRGEGLVVDVFAEDCSPTALAYEISGSGSEVKSNEKVIIQRARGLEKVYRGGD